MTIIKVRDIPNCAWILEGNSFFCTHDETEIAKYYENTLDMHGNCYETEHLGYACAECGEPLEGDPEYDRQDYIVESQLMEVLDK